jgi:hypothetical protein
MQRRFRSPTPIEDISDTTEPSRNVEQGPAQLTRHELADIDVEDSSDDSVIEILSSPPKKPAYLIAYVKLMYILACAKHWSLPA